MLTQTAKYAIRALIHLAEQKGDGYCQTHEIADTIQVPANYLGKTLQRLAHARILDSQKGLHGGFRIARSSDRITLFEILVAIEAIPRDMSDTPSDDMADLPTRVYAKFHELSTMYNQFLRNTTLTHLLAPVIAPAASQEQPARPASAAQDQAIAV